MVALLSLKRLYWMLGEGRKDHGRTSDNYPLRVEVIWPTPIASATSLDQLNELMKSLDLELDPSAIELLNRASA